jgi:hypothetical protein
MIVSGSGASRPVTLPEDVDLKVAYAAAEGTPRVRFFPNGSSSGADIVLTAASAAIDVRVDWFTGRRRDRGAACALRRRPGAVASRCSRRWSPRRSPR